LFLLFPNLGLLQELRTKFQEQEWKKPQQYLLACGLLHAVTCGVGSHVSLATTQSFASLSWSPNYRFYFLFSITASIQVRQHQLLATCL
jgi:hypothetical protein